MAKDNQEQVYKLNKVIIGIAIQSNTSKRKGKFKKIVKRVQQIPKGSLVMIHNLSKAYLQPIENINPDKIEISVLKENHIAVFLGMECTDPIMIICQVLIGNKILWVAPDSIEEIK